MALENTMPSELAPSELASSELAQVEPPTDLARVKTTRDRLQYDIAAGTVIVGGQGYEFDTLPEDLRRTLGMRGLAMIVRQGGADAYRRLADGTIGRKASTPKEKPIDAWRDAIAHAIAETSIKAAGFKIREKGKETPEYIAALADAREKAKNISREKLTIAKRLPAVVAHYARLSGNPDAAVEDLLT